jgi:hypothetical protein
MGHDYCHRHECLCYGDCPDCNPQRRREERAAIAKATRDAPQPQLMGDMQYLPPPAHTVIVKPDGTVAYPDAASNIVSVQPYASPHGELVRMREALTDAIAFIENIIEDGADTEAYDRAFVARLRAALSAKEAQSHE